MAEDNQRKSKRRAANRQDGPSLLNLPIPSHAHNPVKVRKTGKTNSERNRDYRQKLLSDPQRAEGYRAKSRARAKERRDTATEEQKKRANELSKLRMRKMREKKKAADAENFMPKTPHNAKHHFKLQVNWRQQKRKYSENLTPSRRALINQKRREKRAAHKAEREAAMQKTAETQTTFTDTMSEDSRTPVMKKEALSVPQYLKETFPEPQLYSKDSYQQALECIYCNHWTKKGIPAFYSLLKAGHLDEELAARLDQHVAKMEEFLWAASAPYFSGQKPGFADYIIWPWFERMPMLGEITDYKMSEEKFPLLTAWVRRMWEVPAVQECKMDPELFVNFYSNYRTGQPDFTIKPEPVQEILENLDGLWDPST